MRFMATNTLNFAMVAAAARFAYGVADRAMLLASFVTALPSEFATALLTAGVAFTYGHLGIGVGRPRRRRPLHLPLHPAHQRPGGGARRGARAAHARARVAAGGPALDGAADPVDARRDDRPPLRRRRPLLPRGRGDARPRRARAGPDPHRRAAARHRQVHPARTRSSSRTASSTDDEWEQIKLHPEQGAKLVERIEGYGPVAEIVLHHHERFAGGGYPAGIAGEEIPIGARIISVADTYDVMTSRDSYRRPVSSEAALAELRRVAGTQLDPQVVEAFERMILEKGVALQPHRRGRLRGRAGLREARRRLRASAPAWPPRHLSDSAAPQIGR